MEEANRRARARFRTGAIVPQACAPTSYRRPTAQRREADYVRAPALRAGQVDAVANT
jgi:hypothetical protein